MPSPPVLERLRELARTNPRRIAMPEVGDRRIRQAREHLQQEGLLDVVWVEDPNADSRFEEVTAHIYERRKSAGIDLENLGEGGTHVGDARCRIGLVTLRTAETERCADDGLAGL